MKHLKRYEEINIGEPKFGDYVIVNGEGNNELAKVLRQMIGRIIKIEDWGNGDIRYHIEYQSKDFLFQNKIKIPEQKKTWGCINKRQEIEYFSDDKSYLENIMKYNL